MNETQEPSELKRVRAFINSLDFIPERTELWVDPPTFTAWLRERGWLDEDIQATRGDLTRAVELREALRALCIANAGGPLDPDALPRIQEAAERAQLTLQLSADAAPLEPRKGGIDGALGRVVAIVAAALNDGSWARVKACRSDDCLWAFYDSSRNRSGAWCSMASCGNRAKARAYRARQRRA